MQCSDSKNGNDKKIPTSPVILPKPPLQKGRTIQQLLFSVYQHVLNVKCVTSGAAGFLYLRYLLY